jgi:DNA-binding transcriptional regulator YiaG
MEDVNHPRRTSAEGDHERYTTAMTPSPNDIFALRRRRGESRARFGRRFALTARAIESWEQLDPAGRPRRTPRGLALAKLRTLLRQP